ncbi:MAG TPA: metalloregulator ArsR/SmtB family transcription factor [Planctomycetota bacterium]|nr:metalloregulator ArsR/SmtB family transcription factor [Planctomycetota bacterium]
MIAAAETFRALGDPVRLKMVKRLTRGRPCTIGAVSRGLGITRQGARKHLQVLADARLVALKPKGRDVIVRLKPAALEPAKAFIAQLEKQWDRRLDALRRFLEEGEGPDARGSRSK